MRLKQARTKQPGHTAVQPCATSQPVVLQPRTSRWICRISRMSTTFNACVVALEAAGAWRSRACNTRCAPPPTSEMTWHQQEGGSNNGQMKGWVPVTQSSRVVIPRPLHYLIVRVQLAIYKQARRME